MNRQELGLRNLYELAGETGLDSVKNLKEISPELSKYVVEFGYGELHSNDTLDVRTKEYICISSLISIGNSDGALKFHFQAAINIGISIDELKALIIHLSGYIGFPRAIETMYLLNQVIEELAGK